MYELLEQEDPSIISWSGVSTFESRYIVGDVSYLFFVFIKIGGKSF
jgi:hypothetical protein